MTTTSSIASSSGPGESGHRWEDAGEAWGRSANDWACLFEQYSLDLMLALFPRLGVAPGVELLDVACGSGLAARVADAMGATVSGIDAADELIAVARVRTPSADFRVGSMFDMPWPDASFDSVVAINGIWGGCEAALAEVHRVLRPGGRFGMSFWGAGPPLDIRACFKIFARSSPEAHHSSMRRLNDIATPGVAEAMLSDAGFEAIERSSVVSVLEWPDADTAWRAVSSIGPAVPSLRDGDAVAIEREVRAALEGCRDERGIYRFRNDHQFVVAHAGAADISA